MNQPEKPSENTALPLEDKLFKEIEELSKKYNLHNVVLLFEYSEKDIEKSSHVVYSCHFYKAAKMIKAAYDGCVSKVKTDLFS